MQLRWLRLQLQQLLRKKKAPLNSYDDLFEWHLINSGALKEGQRLSNVTETRYLSRERLLKFFGDRYDLADRFPKSTTVTLPSCNEKVEIIYQDARNCIEQLLTDPRIKDEDYNFFGDDPLAPPPDELDYVADAVTGSAFTETYKVLVGDSGRKKKEQLMGVIFYVDGAATGQFANLPVTLVKMSLTCFTREARLRPECWAELGALPTVTESDSRQRKLLKESDHMEGSNIELFDRE